MFIFSVWLIRAKEEFSLPDSREMKETTRPRGYKPFYMLNSIKREIFPVHKCWHSNIYERENSILGISEP